MSTDASMSTCSACSKVFYSSTYTVISTSSSTDTRPVWAVFFDRLSSARVRPFKIVARSGLGMRSASIFLPRRAVQQTAEARKKKANLDEHVLLNVGPNTRRQPRRVWPSPWGAASGDQGTRGERPQLPLQRSSRHSTSLPPSRTGVSRELCGPRCGTELFSERDETSRTGPNAPLELAQPDFACRASDETKKLESTSDFIVRWTSSVD